MQSAIIDSSLTVHLLRRAATDPEKFNVFCRRFLDAGGFLVFPFVLGIRSLS